MAWSFRRFLHPYYVLNSLAVASFFLVRQAGVMDTKPLENQDVFGVSLEASVLGMCVFLCVAKLTKSSTWDELLPSVFLFGKVSVLILAFACDGRVASCYMLAFLVLFVFPEQPEYKGATRVMLLSAPGFIEKVENAEAEGARVVYVVEFFTTWASTCKQVAPVLAELSLRYTPDTLQFVKVNVGRYPKIAERYNVNTVAFGNKEMPTLMLFRAGKPLGPRFPPKNTDTGMVQQIKYTPNNIRRVLGLDGHHAAAVVAPTAPVAKTNVTKTSGARRKKRKA